MRALQVHNTYQQAGGEDVAVANEQKLLVGHGDKVSLYSVSNDSIKGPLRKILTAWQAPYSPGAKERLSRGIIAFGPENATIVNVLGRKQNTVKSITFQIGQTRACYNFQ